MIRYRQPVGLAQINPVFGRGIAIVPPLDPLSTRYSAIQVLPVADGEAAYIGDGSGVKRALALTSAVNGYPFTGIIRFRARNVSANCGIATIGGVDAAGNNRVQIDVNANSMRFLCAGDAVSSSTYTIVADRWYTAVCVGASASSHKLFVDGALRASDSTTVNWRGPWDRVCTLGIAYYLAELGTAAPLNGDVSLNAWVQTALPDALAADVSRNPWQVFVSPRRVWARRGTGAGGDTYSLTGINLAGSGATLQSPALAQAHWLNASALTGSAPTLQSPAVTQNHVLVASNLTGSAPTLGTPALTLAGTIVANDLTGGAPVLDAPALTQNHGLTANNITGSAPTVQSPALAQDHVITASNLAGSAPVLATPTLVLGGTIIANDIVGSAPALGIPVLTQNHSLLASPLLGSAPVLSIPALGQQHLLTGNNITTSAPILDTPAVTSGSGGTGATVEEIVAGIMAALNATTIPVDVQKINSVTIYGSGSDADPMREVP